MYLPTARSVREPSSDDSMAALVASAITKLRRGEVGQATCFSKSQV